jgi:hypothetical protein
MAHKTAFLEAKLLTRMLRRKSTAVNGANASTSNIQVTAYSAGDFDIGDIIKMTTAGTYHIVTATPDTTHVTISPAMGAAPTTGNLEAWAYSPGGNNGTPGVYVGLFTAAPSDAGGGTEVTGGAYARVLVSHADTNWAAPSGTPRGTSNSNAVTFPAPTANWGVVTHFGIFDSLTGGTLIAWNALTISKTVNNGDAAPSFAAGALTWSED